jgi:hypothetical protein
MIRGDEYRQSASDVAGSDLRCRMKDLKRAGGLRAEARTSTAPSTDERPRTPSPRGSDRGFQLGRYDQTPVQPVLDEVFLCHVGFVVQGRRVVIPTAFGRAGQTLYLHGEPLSRILMALGIQKQPARQHRQIGNRQR